MASAQPLPEPDADQPLVDRPEVASTPATAGAAERDAEHRRRMSSRIPLGAAIGLAAGATLGAILGAIAFASTAGILGSALTGALALGALGGFWGGMASLESTGVGAEPTSADEPLATRGVSTEAEAEGEASRRPDGPTSTPRH